MNRIPDSPRALSDGDLVRYLDGELPPGEARAVEAALGRDAGLQARLDQLRSASSSFSAAVEELPVPDLPELEPPGARGLDGYADRPGSATRPSRPPRRWLRAAAVVLAAGTLLAATVPSVRAGLAEGARQVAAWLSPEPVPEAGEEAPQAETSVTVRIEGASFLLALERAEEGALTLARGEGPELTARSVGGRAELRVIPGGLRVLNARGTAGALHLTLPPSVEEVRLQVGDAPARILRLDEAGELRVPLGDG